MRAKTTPRRKPRQVDKPTAHETQTIDSLVKVSGYDYNTLGSNDKTLGAFIMLAYDFYNSNTTQYTPLETIVRVVVSVVNDKVIEIRKGQ